MVCWTAVSMFTGVDLLDKRQFEQNCNIVQALSRSPSLIPEMAQINALDWSVADQSIFAATTQLHDIKPTHKYLTQPIDKADHVLNIWPGSPLFSTADSAIFGKERKTFIPYENDMILKTRFLKSKAKQALMGCPRNFIYQRNYLELIQHCGVLLCQHRFCQKSAIQTT